MLNNENQQLNIVWLTECNGNYMLAQNKRKLLQILDQNHFSTICDLEEEENSKIKVVRYAIAN